jgi:phage baseplate assembly protein gpV
VIYRAIVADNRDPAERGRIKVIIPSVTGTAISEWIWPVVSAGYWVLPDPGKQVWVMFENGDQDAPVWLGRTKQEQEADVHPSAPWAMLTGASTGVAIPAGGELEQRVAALELWAQRIEEFLGMRGGAE